MTNSRKGFKAPVSAQKQATTYAKPVSAREFYALVLFWSGIPPHPKFKTVKRLPDSYSTWIRIAYRITKFVFDLMFRFNPPIRNASKLQNKGGIWIGSLHSSNSTAANLAKLPEISNLTVVIPVFNAYDYATRCLESVLSTVKSTDILVIDDASTDPRINPYLLSLEFSGKIRLITNQTNKGFVKSVNLAFANSKSNDVVLLNSDTIVFDGWLEGLVNTSISVENVATVTAMSNAATIFSLPFAEELVCEPQLTEVIARDFRTIPIFDVHQVEIPTCHGFCVLITRHALNEVGFFDEKTFGLGYGEENDFSMRAINLGFKNLLAPSVVVHHYGSKSFQESRENLALKNMESLLRLYPNYLAGINDFLQRKELDRYRLRAIRALNKAGVIDLSTHVTHSLGGGVRKSIEMETRKSDAIVLIIEPIDEFAVQLKFSYSELAIELKLYGIVEDDFFNELFEYLGIQKVVIQHLLGYSTELTNSLMSTKTVKTLRLHDFYYICPRIHLVGQTNTDCNLPDIGTCNNCLQSDTNFDIETYRLSKAPILRAVSKISAPSSDTAKRYQSIINNLDVEVNSFDISQTKISLPKLHDKRDSIVVAILGELTKHKGLDLVLELAKSTSGKRFKFEVIGSLPTGTKVSSPNLRIYGSYENYSDLIEKVILVRPDIFLFPGRIPETFSYTLSEALSFGIPIAYFKTGAIAERLNGFSKGIPLNLDDGANDVLTEISQCLTVLQDKD
jgi:GT2 family glycosyltransferase/glycosyltransferase involved in cell wall biosynthesis